MMMFRAKFTTLPIVVAIGTTALAQTPPPVPAGMSLQQFLSIARGRIMDRDADGDGSISAAEFAAAAGARTHAKAQATAPTTDASVPSGGRPMAGMMSSRMFQRFDTNGDGYLDKAEVDAMLTKRFERMDTNHDGIVTAAEREAARGAMRGRNGADE